MFSLYPSPYPQHSYYNDDYVARDYLYALSQQQARERQQAQYRAQLEEARRRRAYQEQLARVEAMRRRNSPFMADFDDEPYSSFFRPAQRQYSHPVRVDRRSEDDYSRVRDSFEELLTQRARGSEQDKQAKQHVRQTSTARFDVPQSNPRLSGVTPEAKEVVEKEMPPPSSPNPRDRDAAVRTIQSFIRAQLPRLSALRVIDDIFRRFRDVQTGFEFPSTLDFADSSADINSVPDLLYTPINAPLHAHEHTLVNLLSNLDAVDSHGDSRIRRARKQLVKRIETELSALDVKKSAMWKQFTSERMTLDQGFSDYEKEVVSSEESEPMLLNSDLAKPTSTGTELTPPLRSEVHGGECVVDVSEKLEDLNFEKDVVDLVADQEDMDAEDQCVADLVATRRTSAEVEVEADAIAQGPNLEESS